MLDQAIEHYKEALKNWRELVKIDASLKPKLANTLNNLANVYYSSGSLDQAIEHYEEALKLRREMVEIDACFKPKLANALSNLGLAYRDKGLLDTAIMHFREALGIRRELVGIDSSFKPKLANSLSNLANAYYSKGLLDEAIEHYKEALKIRRELVENDFRLQFTTSLILFGIALATRGIEEDKIASKKLQAETKLMLQDHDVITSPKHTDLVSLAKILDSLVDE